MKLLRSIILALVAVFALSVCCTADEIEVDLVKGTIRHLPAWPVGQTRVTARVTNNSDRPLSAVTVKASYNDIALSSWNWRYHKVRMKPPLLPGLSRIVKFSDPEGRKYIVLDYAKPEFLTPAPTVWASGQKLACAIIANKMHVAARAFVTVFGGTIERDAASGEMIMRVADSEVRAKVKPDKSNPSAMLALLRSGQTYVPLADVAKDLGLVVSHDDRTNKYDVSTPVEESADQESTSPESEEAQTDSP